MGGPNGIKVLLVEDHELVAQSMRSLLDDGLGIHVVDIATTGADAVDAIGRHRPDVVLMDYRLPDGDGIAHTTRVLELAPDTKVIMLTAVRDLAVLDKALAAGCAAFVSKSSPVEELVRAIRAVAAGDAYFTPDMLGRFVRRRHRTSTSPAGLAPRELEVLQLVADGDSTGHIAQQLNISQHTVRNHIRRAMAKLDAHTRLEAVMIAARRELIELSSEAAIEIEVEDSL